MTKSQRKNKLRQQKKKTQEEEGRMENKSHGFPQRLQSKWNHDTSYNTPSFRSISFKLESLNKPPWRPQSTWRTHKNTKTQKYYTQLSWWFPIKRESLTRKNMAISIKIESQKHTNKTQRPSCYDWLQKLHDNRQGPYWTVKSVASFLTRKEIVG